ncbi:MAG: hypothetical protein GX556_01065 [Fibrobacter sp.]|mgnify:CR=1 FL=1|nr:hypothetical protein [Fibrobacter sp.]
MRKIVGVLLLLCVCSFADDDNDTSQSSYSKVTTERYSNYVGFAGGLTSGYGLSFRKWIKNSWAYQVNFFPFYREYKYPDEQYSGYYDIDSGYSHEGLGSLGLTFLKNIAEAKYLRFLLYAGGNLNTQYRKYDYYESRYDYSRSEYDNVRQKGREFKNKITAGGGCGIEAYVWRFGFSGMIGLCGDYEVETKAKGAGFTAEGGIHFRF